jgi:hypothetical protein
LWSWLWGRGDNFGDGLSEAGYADWSTCLANLFENAEALRLELGNGDFFHEEIVLWSETMVKMVYPDSRKRLNGSTSDVDYCDQLFNCRCALVEGSFFLGSEFDLDDLLDPLSSELYGNSDK